MKKATTKRERKYGKKEPTGDNKKPEEPVKVMVDYYTILNFKSISSAQAFISRKRKEEKEKGSPETSYIII